MDTPPPVQAQPAPAPAVSGNDKLLAVLCHGSPFITLAIIIPLIIYLVKKDESAFVGNHAKEALNFHITALIVGLACSLLIVVGIGMLLLPLLGLAVLVFAIIAIIKAIDGQPYAYPLSIRLVK